MKNIEFDKKCNVDALTQELKDAGFDIYGVSCGVKTVIHLKDTEKKNPEDIVNAHEFAEPLTAEQRIEQEKTEYAQADDKGKLDIIAKKLGLL